MAADLALGALPLPLSHIVELPAVCDAVMHTASDRPNTATLPALSDPAADHLDPAVAARRADVEEKHRRVSRFLDETGHEGLVLRRASSVAWFTSGGDLSRTTLDGDISSIFLYLNRNCRAVIFANVHSARVFEEELAGLGFQLKERPWTEGMDRYRRIDAIEENRHRWARHPYLWVPMKSARLRKLRCRSPSSNAGAWRTRPDLESRR